MELVEVVLQGVRGSPQLSRWVFGPGVSVVPAMERDALLARTAFELLACITDGTLGSLALPADQGGEKARAGVMVVGRDQRRYRVILDLHSGRRALQVQNGDKFDVVTTTQSEIAQAITATLGFPQADALREVLFCFVDDLPSRRKDRASSAGAAKASKADKPLPPGFGDAPAARNDGDKPLPPGFEFDAGGSKWLGRPEAELRARLAELQRSTTTTDVKGLEFEIDGLQKRSFEIEGRLKPLLQARRNVDALREQLARGANLDALPANFLERATTLKAIQAEHARDVKRLDDERARLEAAAGHLSDEVSGLHQRPQPLQAAQRDPLVTYGFAVGVGAILVGLLGAVAAEPLRWIALLDIPAFGVAVFGGVRLLSRMEEGASFRVRLARLAAERKRLDERFAIDKEQIERLLQRHQLTFEQLPELEAQLKARNDLKTRLADAEAALRTAEQGGDVASLRSEQEAVQARIRALEEQLQTAGSGYDPQTAELLREKDEIEKLLRGELRAATQKPTATEEKPIERPEVTSSGAAPLDVGQRIARIASDLLVTSVDDACSRLAPRASQMVQALTDRRFAEIRFGTTAEVSVVDAAAGEALPFTQLPAGDRDLVVIALRFAVVEAVAKRERVPFVVDRIFDLFPVEKATMFARALQFLGQGSQVICVTGRRELAAAGTVVMAT